MAKDTKERILTAALDMFSKKGYEGTSLLSQCSTYTMSARMRHRIRMSL